MSRARRLSIMGIRNFGDEVEETIRFTRPLTLIIGQNGVGKTTIIEALRYATTGEFPPGSDRGKGFIHDPMLKNLPQPNVRGKVKAEFVDKTGTITTVTRVMEATRTESAIKFKTVDNAISKVDKATGKEYAMNHRCADIDKEIKASLGLSSAILNNVIFCHQDDSNWPMDDGKKLKERLDEIFDTTRYNKAIDQLRNIIKRKQIDSRHLKAEIDSLILMVEEVKAKELKLTEYQNRRQESVRNIEKLAEKLQPIKKRIDEIINLEKKSLELEANKTAKNAELYAARRSFADLESSIKELFNGSDAELACALKSYDNDLEDKSAKIHEIGFEIHDFTDKSDRISKTVGEQKVRVGTFEQQLEDQKRKTAERNKTLNEILSEWNMETIDSQTSEGFICSTIEDVEFNMQAMEKSLNETRAKHDEEENELGKKVEEFRHKRTKIDVDLKRCEKETSEIKDSLRDTRTNISQADEAEKKLNAVDKKLENSNKLIQQLSNEITAKSYANKIDQQMLKFEKIDEEYNKTDELILLLQSQNAVKAKFETLKSELTRKYQEVAEFKNKYGNQLEDLLGKNGIPKKDLKKTVSRLQATLNERLSKLRSQISQEQNRATSSETTIEHSKQELRAKIAEMQCDKEKIAVHCGNYKQYDESLLYSDSKLKSLQNKRGMFAYQGAAYSEYVKKLTEPSPCCPLCERDFPKQSDAAQVASKLNEDLKNHPERLRKCEDDLNKIKSKHESLLALKTTVERIIKFEEVEKAELMKGIKENAAKLLNMKDRIEEIQLMIAELETKITICNNLSGYLAVWDQCLNDTERLEQNYEEILEEMNNSNIPDDKSLEDVQNEREVLKQNKKGLQDTIASHRKELDLQNEQMKRAKDLKERILEEQLNIHNEVQKVKLWKENLKQLAAKETELRNTIQNLRQQLIVAEEQLEQVLQELEDLKTKNREKLDKERKTINEYSKQINKLNALQMEVVAFQAKKLESRLRDVQKEMSDNEKILEEIKAKLSISKEKLSELKEDISSYELKKRNLSDNLKLRECKVTIKKIQETIDRITDEIAELNITEFKKDLDFLKRKAEKFEKDINIERGGEQELNRNIIQLENELQSEHCCTARSRYQSAWLEKMVTEDAIGDLQVYCKALDLAMTNYHEERMNSVNKSMKNLWKLIYTGTDTSSIQIRTDATTGTGDKRRQFNYKLVQVKHGVEMDMRGRCSAGQRVLASIVIRLALAETFCDQCGMLALDEPTTNLDASNSASLAETLYNYVALRSAYQKSFQLIVITHDEQFTHKLSQLNNTGGFYELYRNPKGLTSIQYLTVESTRNQGNARDDKSDDEDADKNASKKSSNTSKKRQISPSASCNESKRPFTFEL